jgi:glutamate-1-semialdehyde 2,1-aminomutase
MKTIAIIQARYSSTRLPGKILNKIGNKTILEILFLRVKKSKLLDKIVVACSTNKKDQKIIDICRKNNIDFFKGSENNVLDRYYKCAKKFKAKNIVRITSDCPFTDAKLLDDIIKLFDKKKVDYASNNNPPTFPDGLDLEIFTFKSLRKAWINSKENSEKEHVTPYIINNDDFKKTNLFENKDYSNLRLTLDEKVDLDVIKKIFKAFKNNFNISYKNIIRLYKKDKTLFKSNMNLIRNHGSELNTGQKVWRKAENLIPGGTMLFSKNPNLFLPNRWPSYFSKAKGCHIWDLDSKKYCDLSIMGVGTNILGYARKEVDDAVIKAIKKSNMSTLNCLEEVNLAEKLVEINPWSKMVKFARTGGEASSIATRIARAATGRNKIAICGYHGWHDWYLAANLNNKNNLNNHLMQNLMISGVNKNLKNSIVSFEYNNYSQLEKLISSNSLAAVIMEVSRDQKPQNNFLKKVRSITKKNNIVLIFDECTSGFRENFGGLHKNFKINPDMAVYGKALGNGYAITAVVGTEEVMKSANSSFISSTFWTERTGPTAALKTLEVMEKIQSWKTISKLGQFYKKNLVKLSKNHDLKINIKGIDALPKYDFDHKNNLYFNTYITQQMLDRNILASNAIYFCTDHNKEILKKFFEYLDEDFFKIKKCANNQISIKSLLKSPVKQSGLRYKIK